MPRTRKQGNLKLAGSPLQLRERAREYLIRACDAQEKARALYFEADRKEREQEREQELFYRRQHLESCEECKAGGFKPKDEEVGFHIAHLGRSVK